jgi:hypothetical protein|tara:strand:+ start:393 stop:833 length:441 start_codon:yes stop_codon:yes gene_type:complete
MLKENSRQTKLKEFLPKINRQSTLKEFGFVLLLISASLAGCTDMIPDPPSELNTNVGTFDTYNNNTIPIVIIGNNTTLIEIYSFEFSVVTNATNTTILEGNLYQSNSTFTFTNGYAPNVGEVFTHFFYVEDATYNYTISYLEWNVE